MFPTIFLTFSLCLVRVYWVWDRQSVKGKSGLLNGMTQTKPRICSLKSLPQAQMDSRFSWKTLWSWPLNLFCRKKVRKYWFQAPNRVRTKNGKHRLKNWLTAPPTVAVHVQLKCRDLQYWPGGITFLLIWVGGFHFIAIGQAYSFHSLGSHKNHCYVRKMQMK